MESAETINVTLLSDSFRQISEKYQQVFQSLLSRQQENINLYGQTWFQIGQEVFKKINENPELMIQTQLAYCQEQAALCTQMFNKNQEQINIVFPQKDKRFVNDNDWKNDKTYEFIKNNYLLMAKYYQEFVNNITHELDSATAKKINFYMRHLLDALAPTNFIVTNPETLRATFDTYGQNIVEGLKNFLGDLERGDGLINIKMTDLAYFQIGENIALTSGKVIFQNEIMQLIQYDPQTKKVNKNPLLVIPPWINKYYILDLQPDNSFINWQLQQGHSVFLISWINPSQPENNKDFSDYMLKGPIEALKVIRKITGNKPANLVSYCVGGTLLGCTLAYLAAKKYNYVASATFLTTLLDFSEPGDLGVFIDEQQLAALEKHMSEKGHLDGKIMAAVFNSLRANDLIWSYFVNNYLKGQKPPPFDLLYWNSDSTNIPEKLHSFYLREMYLNNRLTQPGGLKLAGVPIDLSKITVPCYFLAAQDDHIVPWIGSYKSMQLIASAPTQFVLTKSGHVAGVINPPHKNKYGYWKNNNKFTNPDLWFENAIFQQGSWWNDWAAWVEQYSGGKITLNDFEKVKLPSLESAPGSYVKVCLETV